MNDRNEDRLKALYDHVGHLTDTVNDMVDRLHTAELESRLAMLILAGAVAENCGNDRSRLDLFLARTVGVAEQSGGPRALKLLDTFRHAAEAYFEEGL